MRLSRIAIVVGTLALAACSGATSDDQTAPPVTRPTIAPAATTESADSIASTPSPDTIDTNDTNETDTTAAEIVPREYSIAFEDLGAGVEGGWITVPVDYDDPQGDTLELRVIRHRTTSDGRVGVLFTNNGGPGVPASEMAANVRGWLEDPLIDRFDVVSWDPRGTGVSGGSVDCIDDDEYDRYFGSSDITPDDDAERAALVELSQDFAASCVERVGSVLTELGTNNSARDMDAIRQALGEEQVSYLGYSYGSELGAVWATLFPDTVRAAVFDGAANPDTSGLEPVKQQMLGFERAFDSFLAQCSATPSCAFHNDGDAEGAYDRLLLRLDTEPASSPEGRPPVGQEIAVDGVIQAMYSDRRWPALERALADADAGDGSGLLALHDSYFQRDPQNGTYTNLLESFQAITCADEPERLTVGQEDERAQELVGIAPRLFPSTSGSYTCDFFPPSADPRAEITGDRAGPIVVIGTTGDPSTPLDSSQAMADALDEGVLVTVEANRHTAYRSGECINDIVHRSLIWLEVPAVGTRCS